MPCETYNYTVDSSTEAKSSFTPENNTTTVGIQAATVNNVFNLCEKDTTKVVGKVLYNAFRNTFQDKTSKFNLYNLDYCFYFNDAAESYLIFNLAYKSEAFSIKPDKTFVAKAVGTGGKYLGKDVTITIKTNKTNVRKILVEYK